LNPEDKGAKKLVDDKLASLQVDGKRQQANADQELANFDAEAEAEDVEASLELRKGKSGLSTEMKFQEQLEQMVKNPKAAEVISLRDRGVKLDTGAQTTTPVSQLQTAMQTMSTLKAEGGNPISTYVTTPVGQPQFGAAVSDRVMWLANQHIKVAEIRIDPPDLGPVNVKINVKNDQANVVFLSHNVGVRDALEHSVPRLRELFEQNGLSLDNVDVRDQAFKEHEHAQDRKRKGELDQNEEGLPDGVHMPIEQIVSDSAYRVTGVVDYYA
jgi:flagellar hook-length control protein FliK